MQKTRIVAEWGGYPYFQAAFDYLMQPENQAGVLRRAWNWLAQNL